MLDPLQAINERRNIPHYDFHLSIRKVIVVLTSPRSGSSLLKEVLANHPDIASLDGEIEPYLTLTGNGFGFDSGSDAFSTIANQAALLDNIFDDLSIASDDPPPPSYLKARWARRLMLQFPTLFAQKEAHERMQTVLDETFTEEIMERFREAKCLQALLLRRLFIDEPWRISYYDGHTHNGDMRCFDEEMKIEEPPFVTPRLYRRPFRREDAIDKVLLFKTPPDVYRIGMYEKLFPNAQIKYLYLTRGYAQTVNGLMDGWLSPVGFFSHDVGKIGIPLSIKGYSDRVAYGKQWWKFDMPPNWREFTHASLEEVCLNQWLSTHRSIRASRVSTLRIRFETFVQNPAAVIDQVMASFGMSPMRLPASLPVTMATDKPKSRRWEKRKERLLALGQRAEVREMMEALDYEMVPAKWV
jgi:hypothetical protein